MKNDISWRGKRNEGGVEKERNLSTFEAIMTTLISKMRTNVKNVSVVYEETLGQKRRR